MVPSSLSLCGGLGQQNPPPPPLLKHTQSNTHTHRVTSITPSQPVLGFALPSFLSLSNPAPCRKPRPQAQRSRPPLTTAHHHVPSLPQGPGPSPPSPGDNLELSSLSSAEASIKATTGSSKGHKTWTQYQCRGRSKEREKLGGGEEIPSKVRSQTRKGGTTHHRLPHTGEQRSPGSQRALFQIMCYFLPKNQGKVSNIDSQRPRTERPNST